MIKHIHVSEAFEDDSVRNAYHMLATESNSHNLSSSPPNDSQKAWKSIWKIKSSNKIRHFIWRVAKDSLPTKQNLKARHIPLDEACAMCDDQPETKLHYLWPCEHDQLVWRSNVEFARLYRKKHRSFFALLEEVMETGSRYRVALFSAIVWSLWRRQNQIRENQVSWPLHEVGNKAKALVVEFLEANKQAPRSVLRSSVRRLPPPENCNRANFNAAMFRSLGYAGIKVVVRNHRWEVMAALSQKIELPQTVELAEARAAYRAVKLAQEMNFFRAQAEGDCLMVIQALKAQAWCNTIYGHVIKDTRRLGVALQFCQLQHLR